MNASKLKGKICEKYATYDDFAKSINVSKSSLSKYLSGHQKLSLDIVSLMVKHLELDVYDAYDIFFRD